MSDGLPNLRNTMIASDGRNEPVAPLWVTRQEAAQILRLSTTVIDDLRRSGDLLAKKIGQSVRIPMSELQRFVEAAPCADRQ
jgi:excisionase family DNA binding protein